jgi:predicted dehydrogenase
MNKIKIGILGVGHLGKLHAALLKEIDLAEVIGIYDLDRAKAEKVAAELNLVVFNESEKLLEQADAACIVTPTSVHFDTAMQALKNNCHLFIEKPICSAENEAEQLITLSREKGKILQVGHIERFNPAVLALSDVEINPLFIESHRLAPFNLRGTDVAVILDLMIHDLDLILALVKSKPVSIAASGVNVVSETIDIANARLQFENGCVANVTASRISVKKMRKMRIFQSNGYISLDFVDGFSEIYFIAHEGAQGGQKTFNDGTLAFNLGQIGSGADVREIKYNRLQKSGVNPLKYELTRFLESIISGTVPLVTGEDGLAALHLANQVMDKINEHTRIVRERSVSKNG